MLGVLNVFGVCQSMFVYTDLCYGVFECVEDVLESMLGVLEHGVNVLGCVRSKLGCSGVCRRVVGCIGM